MGFSFGTCQCQVRPFTGFTGCSGTPGISGVFGVDLFFTLSGYLLTSLLLRERERDRRYQPEGVLHQANAANLAAILLRP